MTTDAFAPTENCPYCLADFACFGCYRHNFDQVEIEAEIDLLLAELDEILAREA